MRLGHVVGRIKKNEMGEAFETFRYRRGAYRFWWGEMMEGDHLEDLGVDGWIILRWIFRKWVGGPWTGLIWLGIWTGGGLL
jgi:hypothetical protein